MVDRLDYAKLSMEVYEGTEPEGWDKLPIDLPKTATDSGFYAAAYQSTENPGEIVIAFRGTEPLADLWDDLLAADGAIAVGWEHQQFADALEFANLVKNTYGENPTVTITVTGHSLGGGLAQLAADVFGWGGETFDAPGMEKYRDYSARPGTYLDTLFNDHPGLRFGNVKGLHNYTVFGSAISTLSGAHIGQKTEVVTAEGSQGLAGLMVR